MIKILGYLLGEENVSPFSLYQLTDHEKVDYHIAKMHGKYANICGDIGSKRIENTEHIKKLSSGTDMVNGRNPYGKPFKFINFAKIIIAGNKLPKKDAFTTGDKRRDLIITFGNKIIDTEQEIKDLAKVIKEAGELPGILNWAIEGLKRLESNGCFTGQKSIAERGIEYDKKSNPIKYFVDDCLEEDNNGNLQNIVIYDAYTSYRKIHGMPELSPEEIKNGIMYHCNKLGWNVSEKRLSIGKARPRGMCNIKLINYNIVDNYAVVIPAMLELANEHYHMIVEDIEAFVDHFIKVTPDLHHPTREVLISLAKTQKERGWHV
jgi:putative DNA primase/helicase